MKKFSPQTIIDSEEVQQIIAMKRQEHYLSMHEHKIWQASNGYWCTYLPDEEKGRKIVRKNTENDLKKAIAKFYEKQSNEPTFRPVYKMWIEERKAYGEIRKSSVSKYDTDFERFFPKDEEFCKIKLIDMTDSEIEKYIKRTIIRCGLTKKTFSGLKIILKGVFKFAKREGYTSFSITNFLSDLYLNDSIFTRKKKLSNKEQVFSISESKALVNYLMSHKTIHNLGLILMFETGVRVGELSVLRKTNIKKDRIIIDSTEVCYKDEKLKKKVFAVQDIPKTDSGYREVLLPEAAKNTIKEILKINPFGNFLFMHNNKRIISIRFNYYLKKACREIGIPERSTHKIRKTYASMLLENNIDDQVVKNQMGHSDINTTRQYYYFSTGSDEENQKNINKAIPY